MERKRKKRESERVRDKERNLKKYINKLRLFFSFSELTQI